MGAFYIKKPELGQVTKWMDWADGLRKKEEFYGRAENVFSGFSLVSFSGYDNQQMIWL